MRLWLAATAFAAGVAHAAPAYVWALDGAASLDSPDAADLYPWLRQQCAAGAVCLDHVRAFEPSISTVNWRAMFWTAPPTLAGCTGATPCAAADARLTPLWEVFSDLETYQARWPQWSGDVVDPRLCAGGACAHGNDWSAYTAGRAANASVVVIRIDVADRMLHRHGRDSRQYREAVQCADEAVGVAACWGRTPAVHLVIGDHGGQGRGHTVASPQTLRTVGAWIGPGAPTARAVPRPLDVGPTLAAGLGVAPPPAWTDAALNGGATAWIANASAVAGPALVCKGVPREVSTRCIALLRDPVRWPPWAVVLVTLSTFVVVVVVAARALRLPARRR